MIKPDQMTRLTVFLLSMILVLTSFAQTKLTDITKNSKSTARTAILNLLRTKVKPQVRQDVKFIVRSLQMKNGFAFLKGEIKDPGGKGIDFRKTVFKEAYEAGMFDGGSIYALVKKKSGKWTYIDHAIGPTDVVYACWATQHKAPKELFDVNEDCGFN